MKNMGKKIVSSEKSDEKLFLFFSETENRILKKACEEVEKTTKIRAYVIFFAVCFYVRKMSASESLRETAEVFGKSWKSHSRAVSIRKKLETDLQKKSLTLKTLFDLVRQKVEKLILQQSPRSLQKIISETEALKQFVKEKLVAIADDEKIQPRDRLRALELLIQILGMKEEKPKQTITLHLYQSLVQKKPNVLPENRGGERPIPVQVIEGEEVENEKEG